ncbi:MAG: DUF3794 domain-containing protein [Clostridia bacterium]|nr:DUF3794 domain-containing protein [Clostridia bacterium]
MAIEPVFEKINVIRPCEAIKGQIKIDCKTDVSTDNVEKVLVCSAFVAVSQSEAVGGQIRYGGKATFYLSYLAVDGQIYKCECGSEFSGTLEKTGVPDGARVRINAVVDKSEVTLDGIKLSVSAFVTVTAFPYERSEICALCGGENLIVDSKDVPVVKSFGIKEGVFPVEEEFELDYPVQEVLSHRAEAVITAVQCGVGTIIIDGEVLLTVIALQKNQKQDIIRENKVLPFRYELECEDAMPNMQATARAKEKSFKTDISVDSENGTSTLYSSVTLQFEGEAFTKTSATIASDAFSTSDEVELIYDDFPYYKACDQYGANAIALGKCMIDELPVGATLLAVGGEKAEILNATKGEDGIFVTGTVAAVGYFKDGDGRAFTRKMETPFEKTIDYAGEEKDTVEISCIATKATGKILTLTELNLEFQLVFTVYPCERSRVKYVKEIKCSGEKKKCASAISVFIPMEGEDLWSLSKRLNVCPETLVLTNKDLQFPLTGKERIVVYRQL